MRYLVISDIHANLEAFETVMAAAKPLGYEKVLLLGDLVGYGADPNAICDRVRELEPEALIGLLPERGAVVASGGGTFADASNRELMLRDGGVVWLDAPFDVVLNRVPLDGRRPLAADRPGMEQLYNQRLAAYRQAHLRVDAGRGSVEELVEHIVEWLDT